MCRDPEVLDKRTDDFKQFRRTASTPMAWHRSYAFTARKHNGKPGPKALRILHIFAGFCIYW